MRPNPSPRISAASKFLPEFRWGLIKVNEKGVIVSSSGSGVL